jgi:hypothetical protein
MREFFSEDLQMNSDAYFPGVNLDELIAYSTGTYGTAVRL